MSPDARSYYTGGYKITLGGVPCRVARKPGFTQRKLMQETARGFMRPLPHKYLCGNVGEED